MPHSHRGAERTSLTAAWWTIVVCLWLALMVLSGGISTPSPLVLTVHTVASVLVAAIALWRLRGGFPTWLAAAGASLLLAGLVLLLLQLVPLPPEIWSTLPHRDMIAGVYTAAGQPLPWLPLNLQPAAGYAAGLAFLSGIAGFLAVITLEPRRISWIAFTILSCALLSVLLALAQKYAGPGLDLYLYEEKLQPTAQGVFNNRNYFAAQLFSAIPFVAAYAVHVTDHHAMKHWLSTFFAVVYMSVLLAGLSATGSRGGVLLAMASVFLTFVLVFRWHRIANSGAAILAALAAVFLISQASMVGILQLTEHDPLEDYRTTILSVSMEGARALFPVGGGFGSFASVYQGFESPADIIDNYVNHAHNDWLELVFDGGLPAMVLLAVFLVLVITAAVRLGRLGMFSPGSAFHRAAAVSGVLLMAHALIDFGLRTPALLSLFSVMMGLVTLPGSAFGLHDTRPSPKRDSGPPPPDGLPARRPFVPGTFGHRRRPSAEPQA